MIKILLGGLLIFMARVVDVSLGTMRVLMIFKSQRLYAALIGFVEVIVYIIALNRVVTTLDNPFNLIVYALGFAVGNFVGSLLEEKVAIGQVTVNVITSNTSCEMIEQMRGEGYGVTVVDGEGKKGKKKILFVTLERKNLRHFFEIIDDCEPESFVNILDSRSTRGGYFKTAKKK
ncbi:MULTISPECIES: DUF2179 domain-containing protein [unclassified Halanaerobium]|uniref:DUF2179 domain-containing protein n=1 Tax=unclassified Halanaerobium TaxID=2641197 RepID=UPI000DF2D240|nr:MULTISPECIES: DUF2179 domain-containing protein [unclassified Halanaerobium]RCW49870.1 uncharacterized protein YebE (UPF0316 family) [Halanaerobium sp. MA284_MarDTE_T2]RCW88516.1 uncharacterized protein YebE (UPF0316 family) [Halanaerobium sp. DL-01]